MSQLSWQNHTEKKLLHFVCGNMIISLGRIRFRKITIFRQYTATIHSGDAQPRITFDTPNPVRVFYSHLSGNLDSIEEKIILNILSFT